MRVFKIEGALIDKYRGCGHALAAILDGQLVELIYIADAIPDYDGEIERLPEIIADKRIGPTVRELSALGEVSVGMCSCYEFVEL